MTQTVEVKTSELIGPALNWAVAMAEGLEIFKDATLAGEVKPGFWISGLHTNPNWWGHLNTYTPSLNWSQGGPLIEEHRIDVFSVRNGNGWCAQSDVRVFNGYGLTPLIAAMRCLVASKLGDTVHVPEEIAL